MKCKTVRAATIALLSVMLSLSIIGIAIVVRGTGPAQAESAHFNYVKAADAIAVPPEPEAECAFAHSDGASHTAFQIDSVEKLKWLFENVRTAEELSRCYNLRLADAADITAWADTGIGSLDNPFTGHFNGGGAAIKFAFATDEADGGAAGGAGLFPAVLGTAAERARVSNLTLDVTMTKTTLPDAGAPGALGTNADYALIENITVRQSCPQTNRVPEETGLFGIDPYLGAQSVAGICAVNGANSVIRDCSVTLLPQLRGGAVSAQASAVFYGGIADTNYGAIERCSFYYRAGTGVMISSGGMTVRNYGDITDCYSSIQEEGLALRATGGITSAHDGGAIRGCAVELYTDSVFDETGNFCLIGGVAAFIGYSEEGGNTEITGCSVGGKGFKTHGESGGIVASMFMNGGYDALIEDCSSTLDTIYDTKGGYVGGLFGAVAVRGDVTVKNCTSSTDIRAVESNIGGLAGAVLHKGTGSFRMENCHSYADSIAADSTLEGELTRENYGGAVGLLLGQDTFAPTDTQFINCSAGADISLGNTPSRSVGGFVGLTKYLAEDAASRRPVFSGCRAYGNIDNQLAMTANGGFAGLIHWSKNLRMEDCSASGSLNVLGISTGATGAGGLIGRILDNENFFASDCYAEGSLLFDRYYHQGGFVGLLDASDTVLRTSVNVTFTRCSAYGDLVLPPEGTLSHQSGGFVGNLEVSSRFENCSASGSVDVDSRAGGFVGIVALIPAGGKVDFVECTASGDAYADGERSGCGYVAGFAGHVWNCDPLARVTFDRCTSYGNATDRSRGTGTSGFGGFIGMINKCNAYFVDCTSYGDAIGYTAGGFLGYIVGEVQVELQRCTSYGNAIDRAPNDGKNYNSQAGGFIGYGNSGGSPLVINECRSYGNVEASTDDAGGFLGPFTMKATVTNSHSYARSVVARRYVAGFAGVYTAAGTGSTFKGCTYTPANLPFFLFYGVGVNENVATKDADCKPGTIVYTDETVPKTSVTCSVAASGSQVNISFTNIKFLTDTVKELSISIDGGKYYTQLVTNGKTLIAATVNGGAVGIGGAISVTSGDTFNLLYGTNAYPARDDMVIRIEFTRGYSRSFSWT